MTLKLRFSLLGVLLTLCSLTAAFAAPAAGARHAQITLSPGVSIWINSRESGPVQRAAQDLAGDFRNVLLAPASLLRSQPPLPKALSPQTAALRGRTLNVVRDYGADNTGKTYATANIQKAIDACRPGDTLLIPPGTYLMNSGLTLKSDMKVVLSPKALVQANTENIWLKNGSPLLLADNCKNVTITGGGTIDGGGLIYPRGRYSRPRPGNGIRFSDCSDMTIQNVTVRNIPTFAVDYNNSSHITADAVTIRGRGFFNLKGSADGMDIESCSQVKVTNCNIEVGDDALCIKSNDVGHPCYDITARHCTLASTCNAFKIGTNTNGEVYNILADGIVVNKHSHPGTGNPVPTGDCIAAIALECNDHNRVHGVVCRNFTINSCYCPIFFELQNRQSRGPGAMGRLDNILIENVNCLKSVCQPVIFNWQPDGPNKIKNVTLSNVTVHNYGTEAGADLKPMDGGYPDANHSGIADAYGIWARGLDGLTLKNCHFFDDGGSKRKRFVSDSTAQNVATTAP
jgi:polygalacturonase